MNWSTDVHSACIVGPSLAMFVDFTVSQRSG
jgi:hypothetical protein